MSLAAPPTGRWHWRRWVWIGAAGLLLHAAAVFWLGERDTPARPISAPRPFMRMAVDLSSARAVARAPMLADPTLFALPSWNGFSGGAWLKLDPAAPPPWGWTESPQWLPLDTNELGAFFVRFLATNKHGGAVMEEMLKPRSTTADILLLNDTPTTQSVVYFEGPLAQRPLATPLRAPSPAYPDVLTNSVVQVRVNQDGQVESAILLAGCGVKSVDARAVALARSARFRPLWAGRRTSVQDASSPATWGKLIFQWYTVLPPATNATALNL